MVTAFDPGLSVGLEVINLGDLINFAIYLLRLYRFSLYFLSFLFFDVWSKAVIATTFWIFSGILLLFSKYPSSSGRVLMRFVNIFHILRSELVCFSGRYIFLWYIRVKNEHLEIFQQTNQRCSIRHLISIETKDIWSQKIYLPIHIIYWFIIVKKTIISAEGQRAGNRVRMAKIKNLTPS